MSSNNTKKCEYCGRVVEWRDVKMLDFILVKGAIVCKECVENNLFFKK